MEILYYIGFALLGGLILNVMPCVLPVLTMKVFHVIEQAKEDPSVTRRHGLAYTAGVMSLFAGIAVLVIVLKGAGERLAWGMQFQYPPFVAFLTVVLFAFGLNALGVFEITVGMGGDSEGEGYKATYMNGIFAAVMATPCSAPFLGPAIAVALAKDTSGPAAAAIFLCIGFGLAFPFLIISYVPAVSKLLPKPGAWMDTFKMIMGFTLMAAAVWLLGVLMSQLIKGSVPAVMRPDMAAVVSRVRGFMWFLFVVGVALWGQQHFGGFEHSDKRRYTVRGLALAGCLLAGFLLLNLAPPKVIMADLMNNTAPTPVAAGATWEPEPAVKNGHINWIPFDPKKVALAKKQKRPVFMDYTADWCLNCQTNDKTIIETDQIRGVLTKTKIMAMKADFTNEDEVIEKWIEDLGRGGIPIYVVYYPDGSHDLLPEVITKTMLTKALEKAAAKYPADKYLSPTEASGAATKPAKGKAAAPGTKPTDASRTTKAKAAPPRDEKPTANAP